MEVVVGEASDIQRFVFVLFSFSLLKIEKTMTHYGHKREGKNSR